MMIIDAQFRFFYISCCFNFPLSNLANMSKVPNIGNVYQLKHNYEMSWALVYSQAYFFYRYMCKKIFPDISEMFFVIACETKTSWWPKMVKAVGQWIISYKSLLADTEPDFVIGQFHWFSLPCKTLKLQSFCFPCRFPLLRSQNGSVR